MFDFKKLNITDEDITFVENLFGFKFNEGQKKIIKFWDSTDIQACPGSGKTTTLAAKLIILANKIPKSFKQGICVITHTNVAVAEIKSKLGPYSNFYFNYPNHFGTIQSVVDKFFTIPAYKNEFKYSPTIDDDAYFDIIERFKSKDVEAAKTYLSRSKKIDFLGALTFNKTNFDVSIDVNVIEPIVGKHTRSYNTLLELKKELLRRGYIKYDEAYSIAFKYLRENPKLKELFCKRFPVVFIDEMQDMETHQSELLSYLCDGSSAIVQKIGDINQSIFNHTSSDKHNEWQPQMNMDLQLTETTRISENIVQVVKDICVSPQIMTGWTNQEPLKPTIILFDDNSIFNVKDKFGELIIQYNLNNDKPFKAIGARLGEAKLNINSYWTEFNRGYNKREFSNISSFLEFTSQISERSKNVKEIRRSILNILCKCLRLCKVKNPNTSYYFTPFTLCQYLNTIDDNGFFNKMNRQITEWIANISFTEILKEEIENFVLSLISNFGGQTNEDFKNFFLKYEVDLTYETKENRIYNYTLDGKQIQIHFDTIHGVKGESHSATLYLETYNRIYDISTKILEFIISSERQRIKLRVNDAYRRRLPLAYVAMTRATHFLCLAVHKDRFTENHKLYFNNNPEWNVIDL